MAKGLRNRTSISATVLPGKETPPVEDCMQSFPASTSSLTPVTASTGAAREKTQWTYYERDPESHMYKAYGKHSSKVEMEGDVSSPEEAEAFGVKVAQELVSKGADLILRTQAR
ncbi:hypothetical protein DTO027B5_7247 [Paecilomyces variotii]|nr:hypothetical protein DTO207G8_3994 [Paecilomyces variotii]KAJ9283306.1 hypothetical protein DTO021C3_9108 [Paecilomyces variotii]KAJ9298831.1 hypothetical protein DTO217A2_8303 [Paecilomyces variotii]KAJ9328523.1 hypothetical protein DTO027B3_789 [Paecilomyces variotii]KAJ9330934.1 hypothetical protein DTO027B5_7247 [Paecilomyces variotii]